MTKQIKSRNPYIAGRPLSQDLGFFGREDIFELVEHELLSPGRSALVLVGQRRIGKTSMLLQLQHRLPSHLFASIYFDLMDRASRPLGQVLFELASAIAGEAGMPAPTPGVFDDEGFYFRREFLPGFLQKLPPDRRPVLLLDEFDVLDAADERQVPSSAAAKTLFPYLRRLMEAEPRLAFVLALGRKAEELSMDAKPAFKTARYKQIPVLDEKSARELVRMGESQGTLTFTDAAVDRILQLTSGHPNFMQLLCQLL